MTQGHIGIGGSRMITPSWPGAREHLTRVDPVMARLIRDVGKAPEFWIVDDPWEAVVRGIRHNLVGAEVAYSYIARLKAMFGGQFPSPQQIASKNPSQLAKEGGMPPNQANALIKIANMITGQELDWAAMGRLDDAALFAALDALPGIGPWTSAMVMLFHFQRANVVITGDVGLQSAVRDEYKLGDTLSKKEVDAVIVQKANDLWGPFSSAAAYYLWKSHGAFVPGLSGVSLDASDGNVPDVQADLETAADARPRATKSKAAPPESKPIGRSRGPPRPASVKDQARTRRK